MGAEVYKDKIEITASIPNHMCPVDLDWESCRKPLEALTKRPRLLRSYLIGIDKTVHMGLGLEEIRSVAILTESLSW